MNSLSRQSRTSCKAVSKTSECFAVDQQQYGMLARYRKYSIDSCAPTSIKNTSSEPYQTSRRTVYVTPLRRLGLPVLQASPLAVKTYGSTIHRIRSGRETADLSFRPLVKVLTRGHPLLRRPAVLIALCSISMHTNFLYFRSTVLQTPTIQLHTLYHSSIQVPSQEKKRFFHSMHVPSLSTSEALAARGPGHSSTHLVPTPGSLPSSCGSAFKSNI